jgi:hypothetical protein
VGGERYKEWELGGGRVIKYENFSVVINKCVIMRVIMRGSKRNRTEIRDDQDDK